MKKLYAPWRSSYIQDNERATKSNRPCPFCIKDKPEDDITNLIVKRCTNTFVMLNRYPYNAGHILVIPFDHTDSLDAISPQTRTELMELLTISASLIKKNLNADALNIGFNLGKAAGGGVPEHLHGHVLPRWSGDTSFLPTLASTKVVSLDLIPIYHDFVEIFKDVQLTQ